MKNVLNPLAKSVLIALELTAAPTSSADTGTQKILGYVMHGLVQPTTLIILVKGTDDIMKIVNYIEKSCLLVESISETIKNKAKKQKKTNKKVGFLTCYKVIYVLVYWEIY